MLGVEFELARELRALEVSVGDELDALTIAIAPVAIVLLASSAKILGGEIVGGDIFSETAAATAMLVAVG